MNREADYSIKGFLYQFNLTLCKILEDETESEIIVEGIVEDIDIISDSKITAIQCKYHETKDNFRLSDLYKPILQMMVNFSNKCNSDIDYILYAHFTNEPYREYRISSDDIKQIIYSENKEYVCKYISQILPPEDKEIEDIIKKDRILEEEKKIVLEYYKTNRDKLECKFNIDEFIKKFKIIFGKSFDELCIYAKSKMRDSDLSKEDIDDLFYPNAIQKIADISIKHDYKLRKIKKISLIKELKKNKKTAISRWTRELQSYKEFMKKRKMQIKNKISYNNKRIHFIIDTNMIENFEEEVITFIKEYNLKYNYKVDLHEIPMFCLDYDELGNEEIQRLESRLHKKDIVYENGIRGNEFFKETFLREPKKTKKNRGDDEWREFHIRFSEYNNKVVEAMNTLKPDILFIISQKKYEGLDIQDIDVENLYVNNFNELNYLLSISNTLD